MAANDQHNRFAPARAVTGFPEFLPEVRQVEQRWLDSIREVFESYGYASIETRSVEEVESLSAKGEDVDKEIYAIRRLAASEDGEAKESRLCLHFDMTVPFARYVAQNYNSLIFPLKRYQIQKAWRGERPQEGRFREFTQCDIDVIDNERVSIHFDAEMPVVMSKALERLDIGPVELRLNNRKILQGFYEGIGIADPVGAIRIVDKLDKIGAPNVHTQLTQKLGISSDAADLCLELATIKTKDTSFEDAVRAFGIERPLLSEGLAELKLVMSNVLANPSSNCTPYADLSIARGLDYYTGSVYEVKFANYPDYPTICGGGRYDNLASSFTSRKLCGVGISIGLTRIFTKLLSENQLPIGAKCPTDALIARFPGNDVDELNRVANEFRSRHINTEVYHEPAKLDKQLRYVSRKGIPYVWFVNASGTDHSYEVKNMATGVQAAADPVQWTPENPGSLPASIVQE